MAIWDIKEMNAKVRQNTWLSPGIGRAVFAGGNEGTVGGTVTIDYVTIASAGNATDFGDTSAATEMTGGFGSAIKGFFCGGDAPQVDIEQVTIASTGNSTDFGDFTGTKQASGACSNAMT